MTLTVNRRSTAIVVVAALAVLAAYLVGSARPSVAGAATSTAARTSTSSPADTGITVTGTGKVTGTPDTLRISLSVSVTNADVDVALRGANAAAKAVQDSLLAKGVAKADLQTSGMSVQTSYSSKGIPNGYVVSESMTAAVRDLTKAGTTLSAAIAAGGNAVRSRASASPSRTPMGCCPEHARARSTTRRRRPSSTPRPPASRSATSRASARSCRRRRRSTSTGVPPTPRSPLGPLSRCRSAARRSLSR